MKNDEAERMHRLDNLDLEGRKSKVLDQITQRLKYLESDDFSLATGYVGSALFFFEIYKRFGKSVDLVHAKNHLEHILGGAHKLHNFDLYQGVAGLGWLLQHFKKLDTSNQLQLTDDCCAEVDEILMEVVANPKWSHHYDLISGLVGIGVYALSHSDSKIGSQIFRYVIDRLVETSEADSCRKTWRTPSYFLRTDERELYPDGYFNLGIAHGVPGVIALLGKGLGKGYDTDRCTTLSRESVNWLLTVAKGSESPDGTPSFGYQVGDGKRSRTAWCYGDLSVAISLFHAARGLHDNHLFDVATSIANATLNRSPRISRVEDASLCHGSQGNAHIYRRIFQWTNQQQFLDACTHWELMTIAPSTLSPEPDKDLFLPYKFCDTWKQCSGYLMGLSGVGLSIADGLHGLSGSWDAPLMTWFG